MATTINAVWDRSVAVLQGRGSMLASIAVPAMLLPAIVRVAVQAYADPSTPAVAALAGVIGIVALVAMLWAQLALVAAASDPAVRRGEAARMASRRLPAAIGLALIALLAVTLLLVPVVIAMSGAGTDLQALAGGTAPTLPSGTAGFIALYTLAFVIVGLVIGARLLLLYPVILLERTGLGAFARSFRLTRGLTWRILGVLLLYLVVLAVASGAARLVVGTLAALLLGPSATATFLAGLAAAIVTTLLAVVAVVFTAQLYVAVTSADAPHEPTLA